MCWDNSQMVGKGSVTGPNFPYHVGSPHMVAPQRWTQLPWLEKQSQENGRNPVVCTLRVDVALTSGRVCLRLLVSSRQCR